MGVFGQSWKFFRRRGGVFVFTVFQAFLFIIVTQLIPQVIQLFLDKVINQSLGVVSAKESSSVFLPLIKLVNGEALSNTLNVFLTLLAILGVLVFARHVCAYTRWLFGHSAAVTCERDLRNAVFRRIVDQNTSVVGKYTSGELLSLAQSDVVMVKDMFLMYLPFVLEGFGWVAVAVFFLSRINIMLAALPLLIGVAMAVLSRIYMKSMKTIYSNIRAKSVELNSGIQENIGGVRIVRAYAAEPQEINKFDKRNEGYKSAYFRHAEVWSRYNAIFGGMSQAAYIGSVIIGIVLGLKGQLTVGEFASFVAYIGMIVNPLYNFPNHLGQLQQCMVSAGRVMKFLNTPNELGDKPDATQVSGVPDIKVKGLCVSIGGSDILKGVDIDIPYGKKLGIMGRTGSGKTVLINTLSRVYGATGGSVEINGININDIAIESIRQQYSTVMQDVFLFSNTIDFNIALYRHDAPHENVVRAAQDACAHDFIEKMPMGYQTIVGERGIGLSGGQKQRISIARAMLKNVPVIIMDDSTSALDLKTEHNIVDNMVAGYYDKTFIIAAHRVSSVSFCDEIICLDEGRIIERGTHEQLMELNGVYAETYRLQQAEQEVA